jgi:hypothetical protein
LNSCEKKLFQTLQGKGNITFYWDYDEYYLNDLNQEAGHFMRENLVLFPPEDTPYRTDCLNQSKEFQILYTSSQLGQAQIASKEILNLANGSIQFDDTAIILCDEGLLLPLLSALPEEIDKVNVTMGLPISQTPLFSLINLLITLQKKCKKEGDSVFFHYKAISDILNNQLIQAVHPIECKSIIENIVRKNLLFVSERELKSTVLFGKIFIFCDSVSELPDYFLKILFELFIYWEKNNSLNYAINYQEYIYQIYLSLNKLNSILFTDGTEIMGSKDFLSKDTFFRLLLQYLSTLTVSFEGEPLAGMQVMGILETRTLDFKNLVVLSVNEGILPKANVSGSFIPYHLRRGVGLPTIEEQNAMYAYYFYRLLQRAEKVTFVYNSGSNGLRTGEKSRFLYQLLLESPFQIKETGIENTIDPAPFYPITVEKQGKVFDILNGFLETRKILSPTALDLYINCPLSYYFKYIAHFEEEEEVAEEVDARVFGKLYHFVMEQIYRPFLNKVIDTRILQSLIDDERSIKDLLNQAFSIFFFKSEGDMNDISLAGRNLLVFEVIKKMVLQTMRVDIKRTPFSIIGLEQKVDATMPVNGRSKSLRIGGVIDRIDCISGSIEIIDYKTGTTEHVFNSIPDLFNRQGKKRNKAAFQTMVYGCIWDKTHPDSASIYPSIYALKKIFKEENSRLTIKENGNSLVNYLELKYQFEPLLTELLEEIFNPAIPFSQTNVEENCQYCRFTSICGKQSVQS